MTQESWKTLAFFGAGLVLLVGCVEARDATEKVVDEAIGYRAVKQGTKLMKDLEKANKKAQEHNEKLQNMLKDIHDRID